MNSRLIAQLEEFPFSAARRTFTLQEILRRAETFGHCMLARRIERSLQIEIDALRERHAADPYHLAGLAGVQRRSDALQRQGHHSFLALILHIKDNSPPSTRDLFLEPVHQQLERLAIFHARRQSKLSRSPGAAPVKQHALH